MLDEHSKGDQEHYEIIFLLISLKFFLSDEMAVVPLAIY
jgi:hypothetical protein